MESMESHETGFHPSHTLWKSLRDSHIPTASTTGIYVFSFPRNSNHLHRKGLVTDVSGPQRNACPGTLTVRTPSLPCPGDSAASSPGRTSNLFGGKKRPFPAGCRGGASAGKVQIPEDLACSR